MITRRQGAGFAGVMLVLAYGLPLFMPPPMDWTRPPVADAGILARLFFGMPLWWIVGRLLCLFAGAVLLALYAQPPRPLLVDRQAAVEEVSPRPAAFLSWLALVWSATQVVASLFAAQLPRVGETIYVLCLGVPALLLAYGERRARPPAVRRRLATLLALLPVPAVWLAWSLPSAWRSPAIASEVDMWIMIERMRNVVLGYQRMLVDSASPGHSNAYMILQGVGWTRADQLSSSLVQLQMAHALWGVLCIIGIGLVVGKLIGRAPAPVAQAVFAFSPYVLTAPYSPGFVLIAPLCVMAMLLPLLAMYQRRSQAALVLFAAVAGLSCTEPTVIFIVAVLGIVALLLLRRFPSTPWLALLVAAACFVAAVLPGAPTPATVAEMANRYTFGKRQFLSAVMILFGQQTPYGVVDMMTSGVPGPFDLPVGALLSPFAIARTPIRLWGDALLEPLGAILMSIGLLLCLRRATRNGASLLLLAIFVIALVHGFTASGDAVSHGRLAGFLVPGVIAAAIAWEALRQTWAPRLSEQALAWLSAAIIGVSGLSLFTYVNPTILPASWVSIVLEARGVGPASVDAALLQHGGKANFFWLYMDAITQLLPAQPVPTLGVLDFEHALQPQRETNDRPGRVFFWSPALELDTRVSRLICDRWPGAAVYTLFDAAGLSRAFAVAGRGAVWTPKLPQHRWSVAFCPGPLSAAGS